MESWAGKLQHNNYQYEVYQHRVATSEQPLLIIFCSYKCDFDETLFDRHFVIPIRVSSASSRNPSCAARTFLQKRPSYRERR